MIFIDKERNWYVTWQKLSNHISMIRVYKLKCILFFEVLSDPEKKAKYDRHGEAQMKHTSKDA